MICKATVFALLASGNAQKKGKSMDNRDNVENMLNKLLKVNKLNFDTSQLLQFGCWLQLANEDAWIVSNKGDPVNELDAAGRQWYKCHQCTSVDESHCMGISQNYGSPVYDKKTKSFSCPGQPNTCDYNACSCDVQLAEDLSSLVDYYYDEFNSETGIFDPKQKCLAATGNGAGMADQCCGNYPLRFPFHSDNGKRGCCNGKTFDSSNMMCCADGNIDISCEPQSNPCQPNPCNNGGSCKVNSMTNSPICDCSPEYSGEFCDMEVYKTFHDPCADGPCVNGGSCSVFNYEAVCKCPGGYKGAHCQISPCLPSPCENKSECIVMDSEAVCQCKEDFSGQFCENNPCYPNPCKNGGECSVFDDKPACFCADDFEGYFCEMQSTPAPIETSNIETPFEQAPVEVIDPCMDFACQNGGVCQNNDSGPSCQCSKGYEGKTCEISHATVLNTCSSKPLDIIFVLDRSGSAKSQNEFFKGAKTWIVAFLNEFNLDSFVQVGIISFGTEATIDLPLKSHPINKVDKRLNQVYTKEEEESNLDDALKLAYSQFSNSVSDKAVIVLSDFWSTDGVFPYESALNLAFQGSSIFSIGLGEGMMMLFGKLTALNDPNRVFQIREDAEFAQMTPKLKKQICGTKIEQEITMAEDFAIPNLAFEASDTAVIGLKFDLDGDLPIISRSMMGEE